MASLVLAAAGGPGPRAAGPPPVFGLLRAPHVRLYVLPQARRSRIRSCSAQRSRTGGVERKVLPVACEQPPRSQVTLPNAATGGISSLLGGP